MKSILDEKETKKNITDTEIETEYASVEDPLNMNRPVSNETTLISEMPKTINEERVTIAPRQGKILVSILSDELREEQAFP